MTEMFPNSPGVESCSVDCFVQLTPSPLGIKWVSLLSSCISPTLNGLSFHGGQNGFNHTVLLWFDKTNSSIPPSPFPSSTAPIQIISDVPKGGVVLNSFMKVIEPEYGHAVYTQIWPDNVQKNFAHLQAVQINLFDVLKVVPVTINFEGVQFNYSAKLFDQVEAQVVVHSITPGDWEDIVFNVSVEVQDETFISDLESNLKTYVNTKVNLLSNRLSNMHSARDILSSLVTEQILKANESNQLLESLNLQYANMLNMLETMESEHETMKLSYEQSEESQQWNV